MPVTPLLNAREVMKTFGSFGWQVSRQNGSHIVLVKEGHSATLSVPNHKPVARNAAEFDSGRGLDGQRVPFRRMRLLRE